MSAALDRASPAARSAWASRAAIAAEYLVRTYVDRRQRESWYDSVEACRVNGAPVPDRDSWDRDLLATCLWNAKILAWGTGRLNYNSLRRLRYALRRGNRAGVYRAYRDSLKAWRRAVGAGPRIPILLGRRPLDGRRGPFGRMPVGRHGPGF